MARKSKITVAYHARLHSKPPQTSPRVLSSALYLSNTMLSNKGIADSGNSRLWTWNGEFGSKRKRQGLQCKAGISVLEHRITEVRMSGMDACWSEERQGSPRVNNGSVQPKRLSAHTTPLFGLPERAIFWWGRRPPVSRPRATKIVAMSCACHISMLIKYLAPGSTCSI